MREQSINPKKYELVIIRARSGQSWDKVAAEIEIKKVARPVAAFYKRLYEVQKNDRKN